MEIAFDLTPVFPTEIVRLDGAALRRLNPRRVWAVQKLIDQIGKLSTEAQGLRRVLTTYDKVAESEDQQAIYLLWQKSDRRENMSNIIGMLKVGQKKLYLFDKKMRSYQVAPTCILDFYVHDSLQRQGYGHRIYNYMLETEGIRPDQVAIDKPSESLIQFMKKHYGLEDPIWQNTNYVVYPGFFEQLDTANGGGAHPNPDRPGAVYYSEKTAALAPVPPVEIERDNGYAASEMGESVHSAQSVHSSARESVHSEARDSVDAPISKHATPRARGSAAGVIHGDEPLPSRRQAGPDTPLGRKNTRDFGHQALW